MTRILVQQLNINGQIITGPLGSGLNTLGDVVNRLVTFIYPLAAGVLFLIIVWGGYDFLTSQGAADKIKSAQAKITAGIIGFVLLLVSYLLVKLVALIFGLGNGII
ncbi:hypothetical protein M1523_02540 [Patescibacteria group bacterium]|nr:hypothetical protein [Patescibacteria group bacterium]MCL5091401.1 hypothetical protein [Patescibacteria group bacterium]